MSSYDFDTYKTWIVEDQVLSRLAPEEEFGEAVDREFTPVEVLKEAGLLLPGARVKVVPCEQ
jgi:hypothetical protein